MLDRFLASGLLRVVTACLLAIACPAFAAPFGGPASAVSQPVLNQIAPDQAVPAQTMAARRQAADRAFLRRRGIGPASSLGPGTRSVPMQRVQAARAQAAVSLQGTASQGALGTNAFVKNTSSQSVSSQSTSSQTTTAWLPFGPMQVATSAYGLVTGRISSLAADPNDPSGNTLYVGATGGGVWKSTNAAGNTGSVTFTPLTDDIAAFANSFQSVPSLSIGAITVQPGNPQVLLAGTGDPNDALDSYYGVGLLRSANGGQSWTLIQQSGDGFATMMGMGFAGFAWSTTTPGLVVAAVSQSLEGLLVNPGFTGTAEAGLYYSTDAGQTWYLSTITDGTNKVIQSSNPPTGPPGNPATAVVWNPVRRLFLAAVRFHGYYSSTDGVTWTRLAQQPGAGLSAAQCPANPRSVGSSSCPVFRGVLAVQPVTGDTFALTTDINNTDQGLYQDVCSTSGLAATSCNTTSLAFGTRIPDGALDASGGTILQGDYNLSLTAVPSQQDTLLFAGTEDIYRCSLANSCAWRNTTNTQTCAAAQMSPSTHAIEGHYGANGLLYFGNDGGLWRSTDAVAQTGAVCAAADASHYQNLNGSLGSLAEISHLAVSAAAGSNGTLLLAGMGGFGVVASESGAAQGGTGPWQQLLTGEGAYVAIDPQTPTNWYADGGPGLALYSCANGANCNAAGFGTQPAIGRSQINDDADYLLEPAPWILDPSDPTSFLVATCRVWRGPVTGGWSGNNLLSKMLDGNQESFCDGNAALRSIGAGGSYNGTAGGEQMYAGMAGPLDGGGVVAGHIYSSTVPQRTGQVAWTDLWRNPVTNRTQTTQFNLEGYAISSIAADPKDSTGKTIYAGIAGFPSGQDGILYSSIDGGAHWLNITNSLPLAPVNKVLVDPNNSSYIYVAGDFGVYYTANISTCSGTTQNCWSQLAAGLPNAPVTDLAVFSATGTTVLEAATYGRGIWTLGLTTTPVSAQAALSPAGYSFPSQAVGAQNASIATFTLSNKGSIVVAIAQISVTPQTPGGDYAQTNNCGASLAGGASCTIQVTFTPSATGSRPGTLTVRSNAQTSILTASLAGTGLTPGAIVLNPASLSFPATAAGAVSATQPVTVTNSGGAPVTLGVQSIVGTNTGDYLVAAGGTCGSTLAAGASCAIPIQFRPLQTGTRTAQFQLVAGAAGSPFLASLSGLGVNPVALVPSPTSLSFAATPVGTLSATQTITVTNTGGIAAQLGAATVSGDYTLAGNSCAGTLGPGASCSVVIAFAPQATGNRAGLFTLPSSSILAGQVTVSLSGNGTPPASFALAPTSLGFGARQQGTSSAAQTISITNNGGSPAQNPVATTSGDFAIAANTCPATLAIGSSCTVSVTFSPVATGLRSGSFSFVAGSSIAAASLSGTGTAPPALLANPPTLAFPVTAQAAASVGQSVTFTNTGSNAALIATIAVTGPFAVSTSSCPTAPQALAAGAGCTVQVVFNPMSLGAASGALSLGGNFNTVSVALTGSGAAQAAASVAPVLLAFPVTAQGAVSAALTFVLTSTGGVPLALGNAAVTNEFQIAADACPASLAPGSSCSISVLFHPAGTGSRPGTFTQAGSMATGQITAALSGTGASPGVLTVAPSSLQFGSLVVGRTGSPLSVIVSNSGGVPVTLGTASVSGDYSLVTNSCGASLTAGQTCVVGIDFHPTAAGDRPGQLTIPGDGSAASAAATLDGTATSAGQLTASPVTLAFGSVATGATATATTTVTNIGGTLVHLASLSVNGDYAVTGGTCAAATSLTSGASCTVAITFTPTLAGLRSGTLAFESDGSPPVLQVSLAGAGAVPGSLVISPSTAALGSVILGTTPSTVLFTASNPGGVPVSLGTPVLTGSGFSLVTNQCGASLAAVSSCSLRVQFSPVAAGSIAGSLSFPGSFAGSPAAATLAGTGVTAGALVLSPSPVTFGSAILGSSVSATVSVLNTGGAPVTLGQPTASSGFSVKSLCSTTLAPAAACSMQVSFTPTTASLLSGLLTLPMSASGSSATSATDALAGTGVQPGSLAVSPAALNFPATVLGASSTSQIITFRNPGGVGVAVGVPRTSSADYTLTANGCGAALNPGASCSAQIAFTPAAPGDRPATVTLAASAVSGPMAQATLDGTGEAPAALAFLPAALGFAAQPVRTTSPAQTITLTNTGGVSTQLALPVLTGVFSVSANTCGNNLAAGASCHVGVVFGPLADGTVAGSLSFSGTTGTPKAIASLTGIGVALAVSPTSITYPTPLLIGSTSAPIAIGVENLGSAVMQLSAPVLAGDFSITSSSCGATLAADASCLIFIAFTPTGGGQRTGSFTIGGGKESVSALLTGTGLSPATDTLMPGALSFAATVLGQLSAAQVVTLTNSGDATLTQISVQVTAPFQAANNCGASLGGHLSCTIGVSFAPTTVGAVNGTLSVADGQRVQIVLLTGQGAAPPTAFASPGTLNFGSYAQGVATSPQVVTISNQGKTPIVSLALTTATADFAIVANACAASLAPGASCAVGVSFTPQDIGNRQDTLTITSPSLAAPLIVSLTGAGEDYQIAVLGSSSSVLTSGQTATYQFAVNPVGNSTGSLAVTCSGAPSNAVCTVNPVSLSLAGGAAGFVTVSVATAVAASATATVTHRAAWWVAGSALALLFPLLLPSAHRRSFLLALAVIAICSAPVACGIHASGVSGGGGSTAPGQTPSGTYSIVVTASFPGAQRTAIVQLVVQ